MSKSVLKRASPLVLATAAIWLGSFTVWTLDALYQGSANQIPIAARGFALDSFGAVACGGIYLALRLLKRRPLAFRLGIALTLAVIFTATYVFLLHEIYYVFDPLWPIKPGHFRAMAPTAVAILWTFLAWCGVYFSLQLGLQLRENETRLREAEAMAMDSQNRMLRYQIDPHFLFNIHNALSTLIHEGKNAAAERMVLSLSTFLRRSLDKDPLAKVALLEELSAVREYLAIETIRYGDRLNVTESIDAGALTARTPSFILQPLVENAIKHGLGRSRRPIAIEIGAARDGDALRLWVMDDGEGGGSGAPTLGVGLENVRRRLQALYGGVADVVAERRAPSGFKVTLSFPLEREWVGQDECAA